jgi:hypothetical protein
MHITVFYNLHLIISAFHLLPRPKQEGTVNDNNIIIMITIINLIL